MGYWLLVIQVSVDHDLAHTGMTLLQWFPKIVKLLFGEDNGFPTFARMIKSIGLKIVTNNF